MREKERERVAKVPPGPLSSVGWRNRLGGIDGSWVTSVRWRPRHTEIESGHRSIARVQIAGDEVPPD